MESERVRNLKKILYVLLIYPIYWLTILIHELGHVLAVYISGGYLVEFHMSWLSGYIIAWQSIYAVTGIALMGGLVQAGVFGLMGDRLHRLFYAPAILCVIYAIFEAFTDRFYCGTITYWIFFIYLFAAVVYIGEEIYEY